MGGCEDAWRSRIAVSCQLIPLACVCIPCSLSSLHAFADILCHFLGGILVCWYIVEGWYFTTIWYIFVFFKYVRASRGMSVRIVQVSAQMQGV
jgi:hypothetical protein